MKIYIEYLRKRKGRIHKQDAYNEKGGGRIALERNRDKSRHSEYKKGEVNAPLTPLPTSV